ncbi:MarR family winged helix-turn-helix transcriptional regulator [Actinacidiphila rubida]|uniref:DNA-binding transcriptional regulator, MarR family n=1 Tax=Actinacidiphila rubida TaxID=310780 RepID=A0A1H8JW81_9ACTN|nr:MarR family winged helix-turn-helix transcriptional regulator [Actinacidiphila rubida]SEN84841.1 DNA-binding transcriptional regulator, MarR family [Actinacidiphila rubida]
MAGPMEPDGTAGCGASAVIDLGGDAAPSAGELALLQQWHGLHSGVRRMTDGLLADVEAENGLVPSSFQALMFLVAAPGQAAPMNQLAQALGFSTAGTTKVVDRLAEAGLVERRPSGSDRRVTYTALTTAGAERVLAASRTLARVLRTRVVDPLGEEVFGRLADAVASLDPAPGTC